MTTHPRTSRLVPLVLLALAIPVLAGCSATGGGTGTSGSAPAAGSSSSSSATASTGPVTTGDDLCALVSVADANAAVKLSTPFSQQAPGTFVHGEPECGFATADSSVIVNVTIFDTATNDFNLQKGVVGDDTLSPVSGLGDKAAAGTFEVDVVLGSKGLVVENFTDGAVTREQLIALARVFASRIS